MKCDARRLVLPARIVVRGTNWVGDTVMSIPAARELRRVFPHAFIAFWLPAGLADLIRAARVADMVIPFDGNSAGPMRRPFLMRHRLAEQRFDMAVLFQNAFESAFTSWLAGIPLRAGFPTDLRGPLLTMRIPLSPEVMAQHEVFSYLAIVDYLEDRFSGYVTPKGGSPDCTVQLSDAVMDRARSVLQARGADSSGPLFCLCPGSVNSEAKRWPADLFARLGDLLAKRMGGRIALIGAPAERGLCEQVRDSMETPNALNLAGETDMLTSMGVMRLSSLVVSNDTGSAHLAVAAGAKVLTLFGPTTAGATAPYGPDAHIMQGRAPCAPCRHFRCPIGGHPCMRAIAPEAVLAKAAEITAQPAGIT